MKSRFLTCCSVTAAILLAGVSGQFPAELLHASAAVSGDVNGDGQTNLTDVRQLVSFLARKTTRLENWQNVDFDGNSVIDASDLSNLKKAIMYVPVVVPEVDPDPAYIHLKGSSITYEGPNISVSGSTATISASGIYYIDGSLNNGQILVNIADETVDSGTVKLFLNGVTMSNSSAPCIMIENAKNTSVNLVENTTNSLSDPTPAPAQEAEASYAVLHAKDDLTIKGDGQLGITAGMQYGIHCNNDLKINGGKISVLTENADAVRGRVSVNVKDGELTVDSQGDGLKATKGELLISGGKVDIKSSKDAIQADTNMELSGGSVRACGDRGLTAAGVITLDGCSLLATASDNQCENLGTPANTIALSFTKEWKKNNPIALTSGGSTVFDQNTLRKYRYAIISDPALAGSCKVYAGGIEVVSGGRDTFSGGANYTDVNNADHPDLLYKDLFDKTKVHKIEVKMSNWKEFVNAQKNEEVFYPCDVVIDGEELKNVAIRSKGNSSRMSIGSSGSEKYSYRFKLDEYDEYQNYHGLTEFCMNNFYSDPTCMRDSLCYDALYEVDGVGPKSSYTDMYLNGQLFSFYYLIEQPGKTLAERLAVDDNSVLYKATERTGGGGGMGGWGGFGSNDSYCSFTQNMDNGNFDVKFGVDDGYAHIEELKQAINKLSNSDYKFIEDLVDVPSFLKGFAVNSVMCNYDSYNGTLAHNYYLMYSGGKFYFVGWDYNLSLGAFMGGADMVNSDVTTSLYNVELKDRPLAKLVQVPEYHEQYVKYVKQITSLFSNPEAYVKNTVNLISSHVQADPRNLSDFQAFQTNTAKTANGLGGQQQQQGGWPGGGGWGFGGGGGMFGGGNISVVDFLIRRNEVVRGAIG